MSYTRLVCATAVAVILIAGTALGQTESATIAGKVTDTSNAAVTSAEVELRSIEKGTTQVVTTNGSGIYEFSSVQPGRYRMAVRHAGFRQIDLLSLIVNVQERAEENFRLQVGSVSESVTVNGEAAILETQDASVSTVIDRNFAENLPLNGRSFQSLIYLTPGTVAVSAGGGDSGQFSVNGQRAASNYWMVDGVSANVGNNITGLYGNQASGAVGTTSVFGGTNSLVSVDAMQEFRIQTSTFAPEYGRTPGAQISIVTRAGTNKLHGTAFDYLRNDALDANNWFNGANFFNATPLPKSKERQNDFGGTLSGPIIKNRTFFFFSYEGLRLRLPQTVLTTVPDAAARQSAIASMRPFLNAYPFDPNQPDLGNGIAQFNATISNPSSLDDYSVRLDHKITDNLTVFGRYNNSPSSLIQRGSTSDALSSVLTQRGTAQQLTIGATWLLTPRLSNEGRFNYSRTSGFSRDTVDSFGGAIAVPPAALPIPSPFTLTTGQISPFNVALLNGGTTFGGDTRSVQRQFNVVDNVAFELGSHNLKVGTDYRRLSPVFNPVQYVQSVLFNGVANEAQGNLLFAENFSRLGLTMLFRNFSAFAQDTWHITSRLTGTYGIRWDLDLAPATLSGPAFPALAGISGLSSDLSSVSLAHPGTPAFNSGFGRFAPRFGLAYQLIQRKNWETVTRGGFGLFSDLASSEAANIVANGNYPFSAISLPIFGTYPLDAKASAPPAIVPGTPTAPGRIAGFDPNFKQPYTLQWNFGIQQDLGDQQSLSVTYVGARGKRLIQTTSTVAPSPSVAFLEIVGNSASSDYDALQAQIQRRVARNLQLISSYTWSHSIDTASGGSIGVGSNIPSAPGSLGGNRGASDFDLRHVFSAGFTYDVPRLGVNRISRTLTGGWSLQSIIQAQSARPVPVLDGNFFRLTNGADPDVRPDVVPGIPLYLFGSQFPGGKAINFTLAPGACPDGSKRIGPFCNPPQDANGNAIRQGTLPRNSLRGFGLFQWDFGLHREFAIRDAIHLEFRAELFNVLNHPSFAPPTGDITDPHFGRSSQILSDFLSGGHGLGNGSFSSLYQVGGPRSGQFALKLIF